MHPVEELGSKSFLLKFLEDRDRLPFGSDHPDVACRSLNRPPQDAHIIAMSARHNHDVRRFARLQSRCDLVKVLRNYLLRFGKTLAARIDLSVVDHGDVKTGNSGNSVKACSNVTCAKYIKFCWR